MGKYADLAKELIPDLAPWFLKYDSAYEEGLWTPTFSGTSTNGSYTYGIQTGSYTRIGNRVLFSGRLQITNISVAPTGTLQIRGLPITSANVANTSYGTVNWGFINNFNYTAGAIELLGVIGLNTTFIDLYEVFDNAAAVLAPPGDLTNTTQFIFSGQYPVA